MADQPRKGLATPPAPPTELQIPKLGDNQEAVAVAEPPTVQPTLALSEVEAMFSRIMVQAEERWAKNRPVMITPHIDGFSETKDKHLDIPVDGSIDGIRRTDQTIEQADPMNFESHAAELAFMNEVITVQVAESTDPNEQAVIFLSINGRPMYIQRGEPTPMRRCFAELLFRAKPQKVKVKVGRNRDDEVVNRVTKTSALAYPFQILRDPNPRGAQWAAKMRREG